MPATLGTRIKRARERKRMRQRELADALGVSVKTVDNWENDRTSTRSSIGALEEVLEVNLSADEEADRSPPPRLSEATRELMREELGDELAARLIAHADHLASGRDGGAKDDPPSGSSRTGRRSAG